MRRFGCSTNPQTGDQPMTDATAAVSSLRRRMIDDMSVRNLSPATQRVLHPRGQKVQPVPRSVARSAWAGGCSRLSGLSRFAGRILGCAQPDGVRPSLLLWLEHRCLSRQRVPWGIGRSLSGDAGAAKQTRAILEPFFGCWRVTSPPIHTSRFRSRAS